MFRVIKAHDGLQVGTLRDLPEGPITEYMVKEGYWEKVAEESASQTAQAVQTKTTKGKKK